LPVHLFFVACYCFPKQKAVTDYKEQVDRHPPPTTGKLKSGRTSTTTTDIQPVAQSVNNGPRK